MKISLRLWRHLSSGGRAARRKFPSATLQAIQDAVGAGEATHRAEVRVIIEASLPTGFIIEGRSARERAIALFTHYRIWDTEENCGLLLYINLADRKVEIVADRGVNHVVTRHEWQAVCNTVAAGFAAGDYHAAVLAALTQVNALLSTHYPQIGQQHNRLSDRPILL